MSIIGKIFVKLGLDNSEYKKGLDESGRQASAFGSTVKKIGGMLAAAFSFQQVIQFAKESVKAYNEQAKAAALLENALKATGGTAGVTADEIQAYASKLQSITTFGDEITVGAAMALTKFQSISGKVFKDAIASAQDLATSMGTDLNSAIQQVGRALEDPTMGLTLLRRSGVVFTQEAKDNIEKLVKSGKLLEAQQLILIELQKRFGGAAATAANTAEGAWKQFANALGDVQEAIGSAIDDTVSFAKKLTEIMSTVSIIVSAKGVGSLTKLGALIGDPIALKKYNDELKRSTMIYKMNKDFADAEMKKIDSLEDANKKLIEINGKRGEQFSLLRTKLTAYIETNKKGIEEEIKTTGNGLIPALQKEIEIKQALLQTEKDPTKIRAINDEIAVMNKRLDVLKMTSDEYANFNQYRTSPLPDVQNNITGKVTTTGADPIKAEQERAAALIKANQDVVDQFGLTAEDWRNYGEQISGIIQNTMINSFDALADALGDLKNVNVSTILSTLLTPFADFAISLGTIILTSGIAIESLKKALIGFFGGSAIVAGAALIAVGVGAKAAIKSLATKNTGGGQTTNATSFTGGYSVAGAVENPKIEVYGKLSGQDILISSEKTSNNRLR